MFYENIRLINGERVLIRPLSMKDIKALHNMYSLLSGETRLAYRAMKVLPRPSARELKALILWCTIQIKLALSTIGPIQRLLMYIPRATYISFVAVNAAGQIVGFIALNILGGRNNSKQVAEIGKLLRDDYQGKGLGTSFAASILKVNAQKLHTVTASVFAWNVRNIHVNEKLGFKIIGTKNNEHGETVCTMALRLGPDY